MEMSILLLLKAILLLCIPTKSNRSSVRRRIEYRNNKRRRRRRESKFWSEFDTDTVNSPCELHSTLICNCCYGGCSMEYGARGSTGKTWMRMRNNKKSGAIMCVSESCGGGGVNREDEKCRTKNINNNSHKSGSSDRTCCKSRNDCGGGGRKLLTRKAMERTRPPISFSSSYYHFLIVLVLLGMCQVSEECPAVCECKWKSGKESVICANAKTKLTEIPSGLDPGTQVLDLSGNSIKALPANVFFTLNLLNLQKIFLSECSLKSLDRLAFAKLKNLVELDLSGNRQEFVPSHAFSQIPELRELKMNSNPISRISNDAFVDLSRLVRLELSGCRIGTIEIAAFRGLPALEWLRLDNNRLFTVQATSFVPLTSLHGLEIHGNPWNCSCALQPFREWMGKNNVPFGVPPVCSQPQRLVGKLWNELALEDFACLPKLLSGTNSGGGSGSSSAGGQQSSQQQKSRKIPEGENTTLTCQWEATPDTKIRWWNGNKPVGSNGASGFTSGFLVSESFQWDPDDPQGSNRSTSKTSELSSTKALYSSGKLSKNHTSYDRGVGIKVSSLRVIHTTPRDAGTYTCRAESRAGSANTNFTLIVVQNKAEHLTGRFLLLGAVLAAFLTLVVSLLLVCVVFGSNSRRHYQSSRITNDDKLELNHVGGETHIVGQNGGGRVPLMGNYHNSHHHRLNNNSSNHHHGGSGGGSGIAVTTNSILSRRPLSNGENHCGSGGGGAHDKGKAYKAIPTTEPDDSSSELENNGSDLDDCGEVDQGGGGGIGIGSGGIAISTKAIVSSSSSTASAGRTFGEARNRTSNGPHRHHHQQQQQFPLTRMPGVGGETKTGLVSPETGQQQRSSPSHGGFLLTSPQKPVKNNELLGTSGSCSVVSTVMGSSGPSDIGGGTNSRCNTSEISAAGGGGSGNRGVGDGVVGPSGSSTNNPTSQSSSKLFTDKYPDLIDEKMSLESDFASLPRPNKNQQQQYQHHHQLPYKHYIHQKPHHLVDNTVRGYFHRRNNSDSQSPLLSRSYGNSTEKITSSGISILSSSSTESSYVSTYQPSSHQPYTIAQGHHPLHHQQQQQQQQPHPPQYRGSFKGSPVTMNYHQKQHQNPFMPPLSINASYNYPTRQRLSMPTSPVHDHYFADHGAPSVGALRHHSGSHDEGHHGGGLLSPSEQAGNAYVRTANSGPVGSASNVSYDYHAAQLAAFLEEYRQLQLELMRMSASLQQGGGGGSESGGRSVGGQQAINSPPSDSSSSVGNSNSIMNNRDSIGGGKHKGSHHDMSATNVNNTSVLFKHPHSTQGTSPREQHQLKSILKNSGNNNNYVA